MSSPPAVVEASFGECYECGVGSSRPRCAWRFDLSCDQAFWVLKVGGAHKRPARSCPTKGWVIFRLSVGSAASVPTQGEEVTLAASSGSRKAAPDGTFLPRTKKFDSVSFQGFKVALHEGGTFSVEEADKGMLGMVYGHDGVGKLPAAPLPLPPPPAPAAAAAAPEALTAALGEANLGSAAVAASCSSAAAASSSAAQPKPMPPYEPVDEATLRSELLAEEEQDEADDKAAADGGGGAPAQPPPLRVLLLGDSTCSVFETAAALSLGRPFRYCDPELGVLDRELLLFATLGDGTRLMLRHSNGRERFRTITESLYRDSDAFFVVFSELDGKEDDGPSFYKGFVEEALAKCGRDGPPPVLVIPADRTAGFPEEAKGRAREFVVSMCLLYPRGALVEFADVCSSSPPAVLLAAVEKQVGQREHLWVVVGRSPDRGLNLVRS